MVSYIKFDLISLKIKSPCVLGEKIECKTCGCIVPVIMYVLSRFDFSALSIIKKLFPAYAYAKSIDYEKDSKQKNN